MRRSHLGRLAGARAAARHVRPVIDGRGGSKRSQHYGPPTIAGPRFKAVATSMKAAWVAVNFKGTGWCSVRGLSATPSSPG